VNELVTNEGLFLGGGGDLLLDQVVASAATLAYSLVVSIGIALVVQKTIGLRVDPEAELEGLDRSQHAETAYYLDSIPSSLSPAPRIDVDADRMGTSTYAERTTT
jgi:Amt family ammonium transporter